MKDRKSARRLTPYALLALAAGAFWAPALAVAAITAGQNDGFSLVGPAAPNANGDYCMQKVFGNTGDITNSNLLNCSAGDVKISRAVEFCVQSLDANGNPTGTAQCGTSPPAPGADPVTCNVNETVQLTAKFQVDVTASSRFDESFYFRVDGGNSARGTGGVGQTVAGQCSLTNLKVGGGTPSNPSIVTEPKAADQDTCGDLNQGTSFVTFTLPVKCVGDANNKLKLPNCTSWHSNSSTQCSLGTPVADSAPETKSKCNCDDGFTLDIFVEHPEIDVAKSANPTQLDEPGGNVAYTVTVTNPGSQATVTLTSLTEDDNDDGTVDKTFTGSELAGICGTLTLAPGASTTCTFTRPVSGSPGDNITDKACVSGTDSNAGTVGPACAKATVSIRDVAPTAAVTKTVVEATCAVVKYSVQVENTDTVEALTLTALTDDKVGGNGDITTTTGPHDNLTKTDCAVPQTLAKSVLPADPKSKYSCSFEALVCTFPLTDTVTASLQDDETTPNKITKTGSATVSSVSVTTPP